MKTKYVIIGLFLMAFPFMSHAQIGGSIFDNVKMDSTERAGLKTGYEFFSKSFTDFDAENMEVRCLMVIANHAETLVKIQEQIDGFPEETEHCKEKKELLEYQALILLTAGTKMFCADEFNSDKIYYAKSIENIGINEYDEGDKISECNDKLADAHEKFGNPYRDKIERDLELLIEIEKEINKMKENGTIDELNEAFKEFIDYTEEDWENLKSKKMYENYIDYITYWISPKFMAKRASEIDSMLRSLPCD